MRTPLVPHRLLVVVATSLLLLGAAACRDDGTGRHDQGDDDAEREGCVFHMSFPHIVSATRAVMMITAIETSNSAGCQIQR